MLDFIGDLTINNELQLDRLSVELNFTLYMWPSTLEEAKAVSANAEVRQSFTINALELRKVTLGLDFMAGIDTYLAQQVSERTLTKTRIRSTTNPSLGADSARGAV
tara:strand:- start:460 stop:777 length:318 start_codon:yes stop_codon:yes gene_type:complete